MIMETPAVGNPKPATDHNIEESGSSYTSLKDILPMTLNNSSWHEIPIKHHLVKQAALAYLQPACSLPEVVGRRDFFGRLKDECGCLFWLNDVLVKSFRDLFSPGSSSSDEIECDYDCQSDYYHKVD